MVRACVAVVLLMAAPGLALAGDRILDDDVSTAPQDVRPPPADPSVKFAPPAPPLPQDSQLVITVETQSAARVKVIGKDGNERVCPQTVNRLKPCVVTLPPGQVSIWLDNGLNTVVDLPPGPTQVSFDKERWTLTIPGIVLMGAGLVLEIVGAAADSTPLTVVGLGVMGVGAGVLLVGVFVPMDSVHVKHDEFENTAHARGPQPMTSRGLGATLTLRF